MSKEPRVSATPNRRRSKAVLAGLAVTLLFATGCTQGQKDASNYGDTEDDFIEGCVSRAEEDTAKIEDGEATGEGLVAIESPQDYCQCVFDAIEDTIPFEEFKETNSRMRDEGGPLPQDIIDAYDSCDPSDTGAS